MNVAFGLALLATVVSLATVIAHGVVSRAPGWRASRAFMWVALSACFYSLGNLVFTDPDLPEAMYLAAARWNYLWAHLHALAWYPFIFGGPDGALSALSKRMRIGLGISLGVAVFFALTGLQVHPSLYQLNVPWAGVTYHYLPTTRLGDLYGAVLFAHFLPLYARMVRRWRSGEPGQSAMLIGFSIFLVCIGIEALVASRVIAFLSPADVGFLVVIAVTSLQLVRRFLDDERGLKLLRDDLTRQVRERTDELDQSRTALAESERLAALGRLAAGVGHEVNNPLTYVQFSLEQVDRHLAESRAPGSVREALSNAIDGVQRISRVVEGLRTYSRRGGMELFAPQDVARAALKLAEPQLRHVTELCTEYGAAPFVIGDEARLVQAVVNLLANAGQAIEGQEEPGRIDVRVTKDIGGGAVIEVADNGPGIPEEDRAHLAEPYFTTRAPEGGLGLGLFVTRGIVDAHGGRLEIVPAAAGGTLARIVLPPSTPATTAPAPARPGNGRAAGTAPASPVASLEASAVARRARVLVVDDEPLVLSLLVRVLQRDWDVTGVSSGAAALELLGHGSWDAILCDLMMPGVSGPDLAEEVARRDPELRLKMIFLTGGAVTPESLAFLARPDVKYLMKPIDSRELAEALRGVLA